MPADEFEKYQEKNKIPKPRLDESVANLLKMACSKRLEQYVGGSDSAEDENRLYGSDGKILPIDFSDSIKVNRHNAIVVRLGEKRVIEANAMLLGRMLEIKEREAKEASKKHANGNGKRKDGTSATNSDATKKKRR